MRLRDGYKGRSSDLIVGRIKKYIVNLSALLTMHFILYRDLDRVTDELLLIEMVR